MRWIFRGFVSFALVIAVLGGCRLVGVREARPGLTTLRAPALAGKAEAEVVTSFHQLTHGPGAEGRVGDLVIQNEFARFIVAGPDHVYPGTASGGNLLDAAVQQGEDRMRLLLSRLGPEGRGTPVYEKIEILSPGGEGQTAAVRAQGHYSENPSVLVTTVYKLRPEEKMLSIATSVHNQSATTLTDFALADWIYHGRTFRYTEGLGLHPYGRKGKTDWFSFFSGRAVWGVFSADRRRMASAHPTGHSELTYSVTSLAPDDRIGYARYLMVAEGAPSLVSEAMLSTLVGSSSSLTCRVTERGRGRPIEGAWLALRIGRTIPSSLLITDSAGEASSRLPPAEYTFSCRVRGRPQAESTVPLKLLEGMELHLSLELGAEAWVTAQVNETVGEQARPAPARITLYRSTDTGPHPCSGTHFFPYGEGPVALVDRSGTVSMPLSAASGALPGVYSLVTSRGPLYTARACTIRVPAGEKHEVTLDLKRVIDPGDYVAVDFRQYTDASPDCALTLQERVMTNECEGVDASVLCVPYGASAPVPQGAGDSPAVIKALELRSSRLGSFSVLPLRGGREQAWLALPPVHRTEREPEGFFRRVRMYFPDALIQVNCPLDERLGYFKLTGLSPEGPKAKESHFCAHFDAMELLTGRDVGAARKLLPYWFALLNQGRKVLATAGSGSRAVMWEEAGVARTYVHCPTQLRYPSARQLREAIARLRDSPNAFVTNGPFLDVSVNGLPIGSQQAARGAVEVHLRVLAAPWLDVSKAKIYKNGRLVSELDVPPFAERPLRLDAKVNVEVQADCWLVALVEGEKGMWPVYCGRGTAAVVPFAATNPFWLDADGDGVITIQD